MILPSSTFAMSVLVLMMTLFIGTGCGFASIHGTWRMHLGDIVHRKEHEVSNIFLPVMCTL